MKFLSLAGVAFAIAPLFVLSASEVKAVPGEEKSFGPVHNWPKYDRFGQVSAVDVDDAGNVYVFHRGDRRWDYFSFSADNVFSGRDKGPIPNDTVVVLDGGEGGLLRKTGADTFYMPHGLTIDSERNVWVTDVALHQVLKFPPIDLGRQEGGLGGALLTLGVQFEPGSDKKHFCKPTGVAVDGKTKEFYVSDGYCNSRILKYDPEGNLLLAFGRTSVGAVGGNSYMLNVPHALALAQQEGALFVADRENSRVMSYSLSSGEFRRRYAEELRSRVFSVAYSPLEGGLLFALTNEDGHSKVVAVYGSGMGRLILRFSPKGDFSSPHDLAVSHDGKYCYVVELSPYKVWKFKLDMGTISRLIEGAGGKGGKAEEGSSEAFVEPVPAESKVDKTRSFETGSSFLAIGLIVSVVVISFLVFMLHYYSRKGNHRRYESRRLILDDSEGGIRLT